MRWQRCEAVKVPGIKCTLPFGDDSRVETNSWYWTKGHESRNTCVLATLIYYEDVHGNLGRPETESDSVEHVSAALPALKPPNDI